ncbi:hypothetical protein MA04_02441 [Alcanivorax balearicus MACL04]|uniref:DUF2894 domain-containing protein n=1 Tax=Alloalcanivorax balearicus MACL04 TaxID=1177182 RepID=A0ABT2R056_9GAMM|nr:DUF2894 domain-containing protein [Alloalcanivorax balearicus]MCU5783141.1 hypothetical protein [Alloalcanivorax balearicus MACL04]
MSDVTGSPTPLERLARLRDDHADRYDPVRFRYLEALARRMAESQRTPSPAQQDKLQQALTDYQTRFEEAREAARVRRAALPYDTLDDATQAQLDHLFESGDLRTFQRLAEQQVRQSPSPLVALLEALQNSDIADEGADNTPLDSLLRDHPNLFQKIAGKGRRNIRPLTSPRELKALRQLRATRARLHTQKRIDHAIAQTPGDAGPLNAHRLVTRSVETLRGLSPDYLNHFVSYMDTLLALEKVAKKG